MEALSDSTVKSDCSTLMVSPTLTSISMTATSLKSPMSGTRTSTGPAAAGRQQEPVLAPPRGRGRSCGRSRCRRRGCAAPRVSGLHHSDHRALLDLVAQRATFEFLDHASMAGWDLHRCLVGFDGDERLLGLHGVAHLDQQLDHAHFVEVPDVRDLNVDQCHCSVSVRFMRTAG